MITDQHFLICNLSFFVCTYIICVYYVCICVLLICIDASRRIAAHTDIHAYIRSALHGSEDVKCPLQYTTYIRTYTTYVCNLQERTVCRLPGVPCTYACAYMPICIRIPPTRESELTLEYDMQLYHNENVTYPCT